jgi:molecular chaperone GrpE
MSEEEEEIVDEEEADEGPGLIKKLRERLKKAVEEKQEYLEGWQRARADFANYKREEAGIHSDKEDRIKSDLIGELLPALDAFELAIRHSPTNELQMVHKQLVGSLKRLGVEMFGKTGELFDHHLHEALAQKGEGEKILSVERSGYKINDKIIRPAQVII